jgi:hypothetical protein
MWVHSYDPETEQHSPSQLLKKARQICSNVKNMITVFYDTEGVMHYKSVPRQQTVNEHYYTDTLWHPQENIRKNQPEKWTSGNWFPHHDNAPAHSALYVHKFLARNDMTVVPHPPYSPDSALCNFFLFPELKVTLKGRRFNNVTMI